MKVYSWNMLFSNKQQERALAFIENSDFDIFCLQEVPEDFLAKLVARCPHIASATETSRTYRGVTGAQYLVTISRYPIFETTPLPMAPRAGSTSVRTKYFTRIMFALSLWAKGHGERHNLHTRIETPEFGTVQIYNVHLPLKHPAWRADEFEATLVARDRTVPTIVCGDFNILESPYITVINWFLGGKFTDALLYKHERKEIQKRFSAHELHNPLRGKSTHPISQSQLDHILVSPTFRVEKVSVSRDRYGSDHAPISAELG